MSKLIIVVTGVPATVSEKGIVLGGKMQRRLRQIIKDNASMNPVVLFDGYERGNMSPSYVLQEAGVNDHVLMVVGPDVIYQNNCSLWTRTAAGYSVENFMAPLVHGRRIVHMLNLTKMEMSPWDVQHHILPNGMKGFNHGKTWWLAGEWEPSELSPGIFRFVEKKWDFADLYMAPVRFGTCRYFKEEEVTELRKINPKIFPVLEEWEQQLIQGSRKIICRLLEFVDDERVRILVGGKKTTVHKSRLSVYTDSTGKKVVQVATDPERLQLFKNVRIRKDHFSDPAGVNVNVKDMPLHVVRKETMVHWYNTSAYGEWKQMLRQYLDVVGWPTTGDTDDLTVIGAVGQIDCEGQVDKTPTGQWIDEAKGNAIMTGTGWYVSSGAQEYAPRHQIDFSAFLSPMQGGGVVEDDEPRRARRKYWVEEGSRVENPEEIEGGEEWVPSIEAWQDTYDKLATPAHDAHPDEWRRCAKKVLPATFEDLCWRAAYSHTPRVSPSPEGIWPIDIVSEAMFLWAEQVIKQFRQLRKEALELHSTSPYSDLYRLEKLVHKIRKPRAVKQQVLALIWDDVIAARDEALAAINERRRELKFEAASDRDRKRARLMELPGLCMDAELEFRLAFFARFHKLVKLVLSRDELKKFLGGKTQKFAKEYGLSDQNIAHCKRNANALAHTRRESRRRFRNSLKQLNHNLGAWLAQDKPEHSMAK